MRKLFFRRFLGASVFFCVLLLISCGIPRLFYIDAQIDDQEDSGTSVSGQFVYTDDNGNLNEISAGEGPSLMLFYLLDESREIPYSSVADLFQDKYYPSVSLGRTVSPSRSSPVIVSYEEEDVTYKLYAFADASGTQFSAPKYVMYADNPATPDLHFTLELTAEGELNLRSTEGDYTLADGSDSAAGLVVRRYNGAPFPTKEEIGDSDVDYENVSSGTGTYYIHVFAAICVKSTNFTNTYWTDLAHLGYITIGT